MVVVVLRSRREVSSALAMEASDSDSDSDSERKPTIPVHGGNRTKDAMESIVKERALRGPEIIWPPELEAALIEGLEAYRPDDHRETRLSRNRFMSQWIFQKTGKRRTAKQVGSLVQQFRDTDRSEKVAKLLSSQPDRDYDSSSEEYETIA
ncbi:hypothetical protein FPV67DRAFT_873900 [Lyophyllum atratum]|nr:hypothetical protein FPV67DRAFT_873900 [Lyophyllum atratum]